MCIIALALTLAIKSFRDSVFRDPTIDKQDNNKVHSKTETTDE